MNGMRLEEGDVCRGLESIIHHSFYTPHVKLSTKFNLLQLFSFTITLLQKIYLILFIQ